MNEQQEYRSGPTSIFSAMARAERTPMEWYRLCIDKTDLHAYVGEYGYERKPCVEICGANDKRIEVIFPRYPYTWAADFNAIVIAEARNVQKA